MADTNDNTVIPGGAGGSSRRWFAALSGVSAAAIALGVGELVAGFSAPRSAPLVAVGNAVIDLTPGPAKQWGIRVLGTNDKLALQVGTVVILAVIAAGIGQLALRRWRLALVGLGVFGLVGVVAALTRAGANPAWALASVVGAGAGAGVLWLLLRVAGLGPSENGQLGAGPLDVTGPAGYTTRRRRFLTLSGAMIGGAAVLGFAGRLAGQNSGVTKAREALKSTLPTPSDAAAAVPSAANVAGLNYVTSNADFYQVDTAIIDPLVDPASWSLRIHGRVRNPITLTFAQLLQRPMIERYITLTCVDNPIGGDLISNAKWLGVRVADLLDEAMPDPDADQVVSRSVDGWTAGTPTAVLRDGRDAMIAIGMNGEPLPIAHGFPARMVVPGLYGYVSATKWLVDLELSRFADFDAYWITEGWAKQAPVKTQSRIDRPREGSTLRAGTAVVAGVAWAQHRGISAVEVRVDGGPWRAANLAATLSIDTWRLWSLSWDAQPGEHTLQVRATDNAGEVQPEPRSITFPDGATGWHTIQVTVQG